MKPRPRLAPLALATTLTVGLASSADAQSPQYRYRHGGDNYGVAVVDGQGIVTRDGGGALYSEDGGLSWEEAETPDKVRKQLRHVFVLDEDNVWTVGSGGWVLKSTTRGEGWDLVNDLNPILDRDDNPAALYDCWMFDAQDGIAVGERGTLVSTSNGWSSWSEITLPVEFYDPNDLSPIVNEPGDIYQIHFFDASNGILSADNGRLLLTSNGGASWTPTGFQHYCGFEATGDLEIWGMSFLGSEGLIVGGNGFTNGHAFYKAGATSAWEQVSYLVPLGNEITSPWPTIYGVAMVAAGEATIAAYGATIFEFTAGGSGSADAINRCAPLYPPAPTTGPVLFQTGTPLSGAPLATTSRPPLNNAFADGPSTQLIVGQFGLIRQRDALTGDWIERGSNAQYRFYDGDFVDATTGVIAASGHRLFKTEDGGGTFDLVHIGTDNGDLMERVALSRKPFSQFGLAFGSNALLLRTTDLGDTWQQSTAAHTNMRCLTFAGATDIAYLGGDSGTVFRTDVSVLTNGEVMWTGYQLPDTDHAVRGLSFVDEDTGYAVTAGMKVWFTSNGGQSWTQVQIAEPPSTQVLHAVSTFGDGSKAVAVGAAGVVLIRNGTRFESVDLSALVGTTTFNDVVVLGGGTRIVAVGNDGVIAEFQGASLADATSATNWSRPKSNGEDQLVAASFDAVDHGFVIGRMALVVEYD